MKKVKNDDQEKWWYSGKCYFTILNSLLLIFLCSGQALAAQTCVASIPASTPTADFVVNNDGTVTHTKTGLMWKVCSEGQTGTTCAGLAQPYTWQAALQQAETVNIAGFATYKDWRVPNIKELASITEMQCAAPVINATIFPATATNSYWTSSPYVGNNVSVWYVSFGLSHGENIHVKNATTTYVRLVRGGQ